MNQQLIDLKSKLEKANQRIESLQKKMFTVDKFRGEPLYQVLHRFSKLGYIHKHRVALICFGYSGFTCLPLMQLVMTTPE